MVKISRKNESLVSLDIIEVPNWNAQNRVELNMQQDQLWCRGMPYVPGSNPALDMTVYGQIFMNMETLLFS